MSQAVAAEPEGPVLPSPAERPEADVVIYDGHCEFCKAQVKKLLFWDCQAKLSFLSLHDPEVARRWPDIDHDRLLQEMLVVDRLGRRHWGADAIRYLTHRLRRLWWAAWVFYIPGVMFVWRRIYRWVARNRYKLSGRRCASGACEIHFS